jgi:hypothetical protein
MFLVVIVCGVRLRPIIPLCSHGVRVRSGSLCFLFQRTSNCLIDDRRRIQVFQKVFVSLFCLFGQWVWHHHASYTVPHDDRKQVSEWY